MDNSYTGTAMTYQVPSDVSIPSIVRNVVPLYSYQVWNIVKVGSRVEVRHRCTRLCTVQQPIAKQWYRMGANNNNYYHNIIAGYFRTVEMFVFFVM